MKLSTLKLLLPTVLLLASCNFIGPGSKARKLNSTGLQYSSQGNTEEAIYYFHKAAETDGISDADKAIYLENLGQEYWLSNVDSAKYFYLEATGLNKKKSYGWLYGKANFYLLDGQPVRALQALLRAYDLDSVDMHVNNLIGLIYMGEYGRDYLDAQSALKYNLASYHVYKDANTEFALAKNYYLLNNMQKALPLFEEVCNKAPGYTPYMGTLAMVYLELGRADDAGSILDKLKQSDLPRYNKILNSNIKSGEHSISWGSK